MLQEKKSALHLPDTPPPVFVLGCPRSGTTLVGSLLEQTPWGVAVETHFITKYATVTIDLRDKKQFSELLGKITSERYIRQWGKQWNADQLFKQMRNYSYSEFVNLICLHRSKNLGKSGWADKTPHYCLEFERIELLHHLFPSAKFVFVVRDGRDVANSLLQRKWGPNNIYRCAEYWAKCNWSILEAQKKLGAQCVRIKYESLLTDPHQEILKLFSFLGLADADAHAALSAENMDPSRIGQWKNKLSPRQVRHFECMAGDLLNIAGYPTSHSAGSLSWITRIGYDVHDKAKWAAFMFEQNVIDYFRIRFMGKQPFGE